MMTLRHWVSENDAAGNGGDDDHEDRQGNPDDRPRRSR
jgi:hypothetical protein